MALKTYDPSTVNVLVGGIPLFGFASGSVIKVSRSEDTFEKVVGIGGIISRAKTLDKSGEISLTLQQTSLSNDVLSAIMLIDELKNLGITPILIIDIDSKTTFLSAFAWIKRPPEVAYGSELNPREWVFSAADIDIFIGGNSSQE